MAKDKMYVTVHLDESTKPVIAALDVLADAVKDMDWRPDLQRAVEILYSAVWFRAE